MQDDKLMGQMHRLLHQPPPTGKAPLCEEEDTGDTFLEMFLQPRDQWDQPDTAGGGGEEEEEEEEESPEPEKKRTASSSKSKRGESSKKKRVQADDEDKV